MVRTEPTVVGSEVSVLHSKTLTTPFLTHIKCTSFQHLSTPVIYLANMTDFYR